jgi:hypothetical protein
MLPKGPKPKDPRQRFLALVEKTDSCWLWKGARNARRGGYGVFNLNRKAVCASRAAYLLFVGGIPRGKFIFHSCDTPPCVNPKHLWLGDPQSNMDDMVSKGRYVSRVLPRGELHHKTKLTAEDVVEIKRSSSSSYALAKQFGVCDSTIRNIRRGVTWSHIPPQP